MSVVKQSMNFSGSEYISECTAVPERRHGDICFMATVISVRDLIDQVSKRCPPGTPPFHPSPG